MALEMDKLLDEASEDQPGCGMHPALVNLDFPFGEGGLLQVPV